MKPYKVTDNHCPECGKEAQGCTHNIVEMVVWICECGEEWPFYEYPKQVITPETEKWLNSAFISKRKVKE